MSDTEDGRDAEVGSLAEETAKLLGALNGWAREQGTGLGDGLGEAVSGLSGHATAAAHDLGEHLATGSAECTVCPVCRTVHAVRQLSPEVKAHLASAAASLVHAAAGILATAVADTDGQPSDRGDVERIDLDGAGEDWPEDPA
ncbi:hypothetical protein [Nocardioides currus]|uniref:Uncharacterized protein n=1 Tax=Nocardioides currus TaxID=2133958 RepID=A0A2R7YWB0_9ACTN|nr:hypothetical protein [Nocardioides currus]PUA80603.1 hypothetical protein C7S10_12650 [Nocardioides currus]